MLQLELNSPLPSFCDLVELLRNGGTFRIFALVELNVVTDCVGSSTLSYLSPKAKETFHCGRVHG